MVPLQENYLKTKTKSLTMITKYTNLNDIPQAKYEGYVWMSDEKKPDVLPKDDFDFTSVPTNPFVIEALLYDRANNKSIIVRHTGKYHIVEYDLSKLPDDAELVDVSYLPHRLGNVKQLGFKQLWIPETDKNCEGWPVLTMKAIIFVGFINEEKNKK